MKRLYEKKSRHKGEAARTRKRKVNVISFGPYLYIFVPLPRVTYRFLPNELNYANTIINFRLLRSPR